MGLFDNIIRKIRKKSVKVEQQVVTMIANSVLDNIKNIIFYSYVLRSDAHPINVTGELANSFYYTVEKHGDSDWVIRFYSTVDYAKYVEYGTPPHAPPFNAILQWIYDKGITYDDDEAIKIANAVIAKISRYGTPARPFFELAVQATKKEFERYFNTGAIRIEWGD